MFPTKRQTFICGFQFGCWEDRWFLASFHQYHHAGNIEWCQWRGRWAKGNQCILPVTFGRDATIVCPHFSIEKLFTIERLAPKTLGRRANLRLLRQANLPLMVGVSRLWTLVFKAGGGSEISEVGYVSWKSKVVKSCQKLYWSQEMELISNFFMFQDVSQLFSATISISICKMHLVRNEFATPLVALKCPAFKVQRLTNAKTSLQRWSYVVSWESTSVWWVRTCNFDLVLRYEVMPP